jgi:murein DD-endopeptidase MepM/ murein hydrolase activator NlpD
MLVIDIGGGTYAFYAHLQRGSLKVKLGDRVTAGEVIGLVGNTGNSSGPHLHFHLMDGPSPLDANGLPFVFSHFTTRGRVRDGQDDALLQGKAVDMDAAQPAGVHTNELPLDNEVVDFTP